MRLVFDLGNTRGKWAAFDGSAIRDRGDFPTPAEADACAWEGVLPDSNAADVAIGSVLGPAHREVLEGIFRKRYHAPPRFLTSNGEACGVRSAYGHPETLGIDRWAALVAARGRSAQAACVVSAGTALTIDFLAPDGHHLGGCIAPGIDAMSHALERNTRNVEFGRLRPGRAWGHDTGACVAAGLYGAAAALVEDGYRRLREGYGVADLWLTGGASPVLAELLEFTVRLEPDLVLLGLEALAAAEAARP